MVQILESGICTHGYLPCAKGSPQFLLILCKWVTLSPIFLSLADSGGGPDPAGHRRHAPPVAPIYFDSKVRDPPPWQPQRCSPSHRQGPSRCRPPLRSTPRGHHRGFTVPDYSVFVNGPKTHRMDVFVTQPDGRARQVFFLDPDDRSSSTSTKLVLRCFAAASQTERKGSSGTSPLGKTAVPVIANCVPTLSAIEFRLVGTTLHVEALLVCKGRFWSEKANNQMVLLMHIRFIRCDVSQHNKIDKQEAAQERLISKKH